MKSRHLEFKIGITTLVALICLMGMLLGVEKINIFAETYKLKIGFPDARQLLINSAVNLSGVKIGRITRLTVNPSYDPQKVAIVDVDIYKEYRIPAGSEFKIATSGLFGNNFIKVVPPTFNSEKDVKYISMTDKTIFAGKTPATFDDLLQKGNLTMGKLDSILANINELVSDQEIKTDIKQIISNVNSTTGKIDVLVMNLQNDLHDVSQSVIAVTKSLRDVLDKNNKNIELTMQNVAELSKEFKEIAKTNRPKIDSILQRIDNITKGIDGNGEFEKSMGKIRNNFVKVSDNLQNLTKRANDVLGNPKLETKVHKAIDSATRAADALSDIKSDLDSIKTTFSSQVLFNNEHHDFESNYYVDSVFKEKFQLRLGFENPTENTSRTIVQGGIVKPDYSFRAGMFDDYFGLNLEKHFSKKWTLGIDSYNLNSPTNRVYSKHALNEHTSLVLKMENATRDNKEFLVGVSHKF
jgi:phospholipid/cholesterol/gamma-HCH transport system substrate-binding protein